MSENSILDQRLRVPYSIGTGIPKGGDAEIEGYLQSLRVQGFCVIERVIPEDQVEATRESVLRGRELLQKDREAERTRAVSVVENGEESATQFDERLQFGEQRLPVRGSVWIEIRAGGNAEREHHLVARGFLCQFTESLHLVGRVRSIPSSPGVRVVTW